MEFKEIKQPSKSCSVSDTSLKTCIVCKELPPYARLYRCNMGGHIICQVCLHRLQKNGSAQCLHCNSVFLKMRDNPRNQKQPVTVEELFQLPTAQVNLLLNKRYKISSTDLRQMRDSDNLSSAHSSPSSTTVQNYASKPFKCPHGPCGKTINSSSLKAHFSIEHSGIATYSTKRGEELNIVTNVAAIEHNTTSCIGLIEVFDEFKLVSRAVENVCKQYDKKFSVAVFWLLLSGSEEKTYAKAHALYWLVTDSEIPFKCSLEMSSMSNHSSCATFCGVNDVRDELPIKAVSRQLNCLYLTYSSLKNLKGQQGDANLHIIIH